MKINVENLKRNIEIAKRDIEKYNDIIKCNNSRTGNKSAGDHAKVMKKSTQEKIKSLRDRIARIRKMGC